MASALMTDLMDAGQYGLARTLEYAREEAERAALSPSDRFGRNDRYDRACEYLSTTRKRAYLVLSSSHAKAV